MTDQTPLIPLQMPDLSQYTKDELVDLALKLKALGTKTFKDYVPHPKQRLFHLSTCPIRLILGGNRSGKTISAFHDVMWQLTGDYPKWYPATLQLDTPVYSRWIATDFKQGVGGVFQPYFEQLVPASYYKRIVKTQQGILSKVFFKNGSILEILTDEQELAVFEGWHGHRVHIDEPCGRERYIASKRGLIDYAGKVSFSLTPLSEPWIYDEIYEKADDERIFAITVDIHDNPYLNIHEVQEFEKSLTDDEKEARLHGKFTHLSGLIYKSFDRSVHVVKSFEIPANWPVVMCLDPHDRRGHCVTWAAVDPYDALYFFDDMEFAGTAEQLVDEIRKRESIWNLNINKFPIHRIKRLIDPNKGKSPAKLGDKGDLIMALRRLKMDFFGNINDDITEGHLEVMRYLQYDKTQPIGERNKPQLFVFNNCYRILQGFSHYLWDEFKDSAGKPDKEKPRDLYKDFPDCIRYTCMIRPKYKKPVARTGEWTSPTDTGY